MNVEDGYDEINEEIFNDGFDFEAAVEELDIAKMDEKEKFLEIINEVAALSSTEEEELLVEALTGFFEMMYDSLCKGVESKKEVGYPLVNR
jgi:hypothetical protein